MGGTSWDGQLLFYDNSGSPSVFWDPFLRDNSSWYHIVIVHNSAHHDSLDRVKAYVNGIQLNRSVDTFHSPTELAERADGTFNQRLEHTIGAWRYTSSISRYPNANLCDMYLVDGQACGPETFGYRNQKYGTVKHSNLHTEDISSSNAHYSQLRYSGEWFPRNPHQVLSLIHI